MIASLPMYDTPATAAANDRFWDLIRRAYGRGPEKLDRTQDPHRTWRDPGLVFSQTCGLPFRTELAGRVQLIGTPDYGVPDCPPGFYCSCIIVRADDDRTGICDYLGARLARNDRRSQSGWAALDAHLQSIDPSFRFHPHIIESGSHAASMAAVADGRADIAAIDAVSWAFLRDTRADAPKLRVLGRTRPTPGLPYISGLGEDRDKLFRSVQHAMEDLSSSDRHMLKLRGLMTIPAQVYMAVPPPRAGSDAVC